MRERSRMPLVPLLLATALALPCSSPATPRGTATAVGGAGAGACFELRRFGREGHAPAGAATSAFVTAARRGLACSLRMLHVGVGSRLPDDGTVVARDEGRRVLCFPVREQTRGLFVDIEGCTQFERLDIAFQDGSTQSIDAFGVDRDTGLYEIASFAAARAVDWVRVVLRAKSRRARVEIKLAG